MKIIEMFVADILKAEYGAKFQEIYDKSLLIQYLDKKMKAVHGDSKTRRNLANIYAIYSVLYFYKEDFYEQRQKYLNFEGYDYMKLFHFYRSLYGGSKLQNHALNSRVNGEFRNKLQDVVNDLIIAHNGKYLLHVDYLYVNGHDVSKTVCRIIAKYIEMLVEKDHALIRILAELSNMSECMQKAEKLKELLTENAEARIFEIISYAILKNHYRNVHVYFGYTQNTVKEVTLELFKTGRTNANDGGIDFVMRPVGRFFQVTEVNDYDKYLLDMDKVMHFPITFVIKSKQSKSDVLTDLKQYIKERSGGMAVLEERYNDSIEEIITINELQAWMDDLNANDIDNIIRDIDRYYRLEMNVEIAEM